MNEYQEQIRKYIARRLREVRIDRGITQCEMAKRCGADQARVAEVESGRYGMTVNTLAKLMYALDVSPDELFNNAPAPQSRRYQ